MCITIYNPSLINDDNKFLKSFVGYEFVSLLGVIASITIATTSQIHTMLNDIERAANKRILHKTRHGIQTDVLILIGIFNKILNIFYFILFTNYEISNNLFVL